MLSQRCHPRFWSLSCGLLLLLASATTLFAQDLRTDTALKYVPADAAFYGSMLRNREQIEMFVSSNAFKALWKSPMVQQGIAAAKRGMAEEDGFQKMKEFFEASENREILDVLKAAMSDEIALYGDVGFATWLKAMNRFSQSANMAQLEAAATGQDVDEVMRKKVMDQLTDNPELLKVPTFVVAFKLGDTTVAERQLARLETLVRGALESEQPQLAERFARVKLGGGEYLTFKLDGTLIPWDEALKQSDLSDAAKDQLKDKLQEIEVAISLGTRDGYLFWSIGSSNEHLAKMGSGDLLVDREEMQILEEARGKKLTSIGYASADFLRTASAVDQQLQQMVDLMKTALPLAPIADDIKDDLAKDVETLGKKLQALVPQMGAVASYGFISDQGFESVAYNWSEQPSLDGSKPLSILEHLGTSPVAFFAGRTKSQPDAEALARSFCEKFGSYAERIGGQFLNDEQQQLYTQLKKEFLPLLKRLDTANQEKLTPAFKDGQGAVVLSANLTAPQWHLMMPPSEQPLPLPQLSFVYGVSDAASLRAGAAEYYSVAQDAVTKLAEMFPDNVPPIEVPKPMTQDADGGTLYMYGLPPQLGVDHRLAPNAGLSDSFMVISLAPTTTTDLLQSSSLNAPGPLADTDQSLATAWHFSMQKLVQMVRPWIAYGIAQAEAQGEDVQQDWVDQVDVILDVMECFRGVTGASYMKDGALVTHSLAVFEDL